MSEQNTLGITVSNPPHPPPKASSIDEKMRLYVTSMDSYGVGLIRVAPYPFSLYGDLFNPSGDSIDVASEYYTYIADMDKDVWITLLKRAAQIDLNKIFTSGITACELRRIESCIWRFLFCCVISLNIYSAILRRCKTTAPNAIWALLGIR